MLWYASDDLPFASIRQADFQKSAGVKSSCWLAMSDVSLAGLMTLDRSSRPATTTAQPLKHIDVYRRLLIGNVDL